MLFSQLYTSAFILLISHDLANAYLVLKCPIGVSSTHYSPSVRYVNSTSKIIITGTKNYTLCNDSTNYKVYVTIRASGPIGTSCTTLFKIPLNDTFTTNSESDNSSGSDAILYYNSSKDLFQAVYLGFTDNNQGPFPYSYYRLTYIYDSIGPGIYCATEAGLQNLKGTAVLEVGNTAFNE